jgi:hypothetical protein
MIIERIQVEGGFLDGLDLRIANGLNVLVGARGAGKTSVIELLRFCLGSTALTEKGAQSAREHALSILGSGSVAVSIATGVESITLNRSADQWTSTNTAVKVTAPVVLSQNEIESVGLSAASRLKLIDSIRPTAQSSSREEERLLSYIRSQTEERRSTNQELKSIRAKLSELELQVKETEALKKQHEAALSSIQKAASQTARLQQLDSWLAALAVRGAVFDRALQSLQQWRNKLQAQFAGRFALDTWPAAAKSKDDPLVAARGFVAAALANLQAAEQEAAKAIAEVNRLAAENTQQAVQYSTEGRELRRQLDSLKQGAGEIAKKLAALQERIGQQSALRELEKAKVQRLRMIQAERKGYLDQLDAIRARRYDERAKIIKDINAELGPQIRLSIQQAGQNSEYASAIVGALRGSGLRFNEVAPMIAGQMSPSEFVEAVENEDVQALADATGITMARAARIIERINEQGVEGILTAPVEDGVLFCLLDGKEYKTTEELSTGQRCTVVLPLLLKQRPLSLIVDQPEDNLDNAFIVDTVVKAISQRKQEGQLIFATHNANIPVLGEADRVIVMASDGARGFVRYAGGLDDPASVNAITSLMEGGIEAFDRRARFYHSREGHGAP